VTCREVTDFLLEYLSGELPAAQRKVFDEHLAECPDCVTYLTTYQQTIQLEKAAFAHADEAIPKELVQAILAARRRR
jgi:anti-sigma factor RsiW